MKNIFAFAALGLIASCSMLPQKADREKQLADVAKEVDVPTIENTLYTSGDEALKSGDSLKAEYNFSQLIKQDPKNSTYKFKYAEALRRRGACVDAIPLYDQALKDRPDDLDVVEGKALCLVSGGEFEKAGPILTDIIQKDSNRWKSVNAAGLIFAVNKKFQEANQYFDLAAEVSNRNPAVLNNQALVKALVGNYDDAIKTLKEASLKAGEGTGQRRQVDLNLAMVYGISKKMDLAEDTARPHLTKPQLFNNMGIYAELAKDPALARTYLNKALMGTAVYYDRAWNNLEKVGTGTSTRSSAPEPAATPLSGDLSKPKAKEESSSKEKPKAKEDKKKKK